MKLLLLCWLLLLAYASNAQLPLSASAGDSAAVAAPPNLLQAATVPTPGATSTELYLRAKLWLLNNHSIGRYKWLGDRNTNLVALKGAYYLPTIGFGGTWLYYSLKLLLHEGSYHYAVTDVYFRKNTVTTTETIPAGQVVAAASTRRADRRYQESLAQHVDLLLSSLRTGMQQPATR